MLHTLLLSKSQQDVFLSQAGGLGSLRQHLGLIWLYELWIAE
jgi:hypothetical protein